MLSRLFNLYLCAITRFPGWILGFILALTIGLAAGLPNFKLDASADSLTLENDSDLEFFRDVIKEYGSGDFLVVTFRPKEDLFSDASLELLGKLKTDLARIPGVVSVNSILDVPLLYSPMQSLSEIASKPRTLLTPGMDREMAKQEFLTSPIYKKLILGPDGQTTALQLNLAVDKKYLELVQKRDGLRAKRHYEHLTNEEAKELEAVTAEFLAYRTQSEAAGHKRVEDVRAVVNQYKDRAQIFVGGLTMITADMITFIQNDLFVFGFAVIAFMIVLLAFIFRSLRFVLIPMLSCSTAVLMMLGFVSWVDWRLTVISSNFVALLLIISLAIIIHLVVRYKEYAAENPDWSQEQLVRATVQFMARPCFYTALTTIVAFASLVISDIRPVIDFGWMMTIGLVVALVLGFVLLPASLMLLPRDNESENKKASETKSKPSKPVTLYFSKIVERFGAGVFIGSLIVAAASVYGISRLQVENRFIDFFHDTTEIYQGLSVIDTELGGTTSLDIILDAEKPASNSIADDFTDGFSDEDDPFGEADPFDETDPFEAPDPVAEEDPFAEADPFSEHGSSGPSYWMTVAGLQKVEALHDYLDAQPEIGKVQSLATLYKVGRDINGSLNDFELALMNKALSGDVRSVLVSPYLYDEKNQTRITLRIVDTYPGLQRAELVQRIKNHIDESNDIKLEDTHFTGLLVLYNNMLKSLFTSQIVTLGLVFVAITFMFIILFRSFVIAVVSIIPNILAALSILGAMGLMGLPLDMMTITVAAITVGIGVDDTIHYIHRFKKEFEVDRNYVAAMHRAHASIGKAMYYTSIIIVFGFSIMVLSEFIPTIYFGLLTGLAMFAALMGALLLLPKLILLVKPFGSEA